MWQLHSIPPSLGGMTLSREQHYISEIQREADLICSELSKLTRNNTDVTNEKLNELIQLGLSISMKCSELLD